MHAASWLELRTPLVRHKALIWAGTPAQTPNIRLDVPCRTLTESPIAVTDCNPRSSEVETPP